MKAFISVDLEGMPYITIPGHLDLKGTQYEEARKIATKITLTVAQELHNNGFQQIVVADSHGPMVNILTDDLPEYLEIIRGYPRPVSMIAGLEGCDAAIFIGYHAKFGTAHSAFDHTYSGSTINKLQINSLEVSEFLLNAYAAGDLNVPVILAAGEAQLIQDDVKKHTPWTETVTLKHSLSRLSTRSHSMSKIEKQLKETVKKAAANFQQGKTKPLTTKKPVKTQITTMNSLFADIAELLPIIKRIDGLNVEYTAKNMNEAYRIFEFLALSASALNAYLAKLT